eukprot:m.36743 g.36743  ORF g.36743 m.36743 type:complete len:325 (+) comp5437_c0_seq2:51-1025(+)
MCRLATCGLRCLASIIWKVLFLFSGALIIAGSSLVWDENPFNLDGNALDRFRFDVFVFWVGWALCFCAYFFRAESFVVAAAGLCVATFTYRQADVQVESNGVLFDGSTGNLASIPALTMCRLIYGNTNTSKNTGATWDPNYQARAVSGYSYAMSEDKAQLCTIGLSLMYAGQLLALILGAKSGKQERECPRCVVRLLALGVALTAAAGSAVLLASDEARLAKSTYFTLHDQVLFNLLTGLYCGLAYFTRQDGLMFATAFLAAFCAITNVSTMFVITGTTSASVADIESGFVLVELAVLGACVVAVINKEFFHGGEHKKIVPFTP